MLDWSRGGRGSEDSFFRGDYLLLSMLRDDFVV